MKNMPNNALIAMSGGVDSTVAALLTAKDGLGCAGAMMKLHPGAGESADARAAADRLGIPFYVFDMSECFSEQVIARFIAAYREGRTPNPCIDCNRNLKFGAFLKKALETGYDGVVTGHYARTERDGLTGRYLLKKAADGSKDQSYVLYSLTQEQLSRIRFPLGGLTKQRVREIALAEGFNNAGRRESQDICFIPDGDYAKFIEQYTGETPKKGRFVDTSGNDLGENRGVVCYTVGQRRGLGLAMPYPAYVTDIRTEDGTVVVGRKEELYSKALTARDVNFIPFDRLDRPMRIRAKIRYNQTEQPATVEQTGPGTIHIEFDEPQRAITKGQAAVIYEGDIVIGGGTIT